MIKDRLAREKRKSDERIRNAIKEAKKLAKMKPVQCSMSPVFKF
ncbi:hypothetical protein ACFY3K_03815 [Staphylococcus capitis]